MTPITPRQNPQADALADAFDDDARACLSALADGEADAASAQRGCIAWRDDPEARRNWHAYQLIGDVLRSDELASTPARDAAFLTALRGKLAQEPVVLAPMPAAAARPSRFQQRWLAPAAVAAGFVAVAGVLVVTRVSAPEAAATSVQASSNKPAPNFTLATGPAVASSSAEGDAMLRDARLDAYLNAHQAARRGGAVALPGMGLRSVEVVIPVGREP
jgi:sigma-E factor negative regulatory protein RseA